MAFDNDEYTGAFGQKTRTFKELQENIQKAHMAFPEDKDESEPKAPKPAKEDKTGEDPAAEEADPAEGIKPGKKTPEELLQDPKELLDPEGDPSYSEMEV